MKELHIMPINDIREHEADAGCFCKPQQDSKTPGLFIHNSLDRREVYEEKPELQLN